MFLCQSIKTEGFKLVLKSRLLLGVFHFLLEHAKKMEQKIRSEKGNSAIISLMDQGMMSLIEELYQLRRIDFRAVPQHGAPGGDTWEPDEEIPGSHWLSEDCSKNPNKVVRMLFRLSVDYKEVVTVAVEQGLVLPVDIQTGEEWLYGALAKWSAPTVGAGLIDHSVIRFLTQDFEYAIARKGADFFAIVHGNITPDHALIDKNGIPYLFGMRLVVRPGRYYDFMRGIDWLLLKGMPISDETFDQVVVWLRRYLKDENWEEIQMIFALRCLGILWDILYRGETIDKGRKNLLIPILVRFIERRY